MNEITSHNDEQSEGVLGDEIVISHGTVAGTPADVVREGL